MAFEFVRDVHVDFLVTAPDLEPSFLTEVVGILPYASAPRGAKRFNFAGSELPPHDYGWWRLSSREAVSSKDINDHLDFLMTLLLPHADMILSCSESGERGFDVHWESTYLYAGDGPEVSARNCLAIGQLKADLGFDIYYIEEPEAE